MTDNAQGFDAWLRANAHRKPPRIDDMNRKPQPTATTNDRRGIEDRLRAEWAAQTDTETETPA